MNKSKLTAVAALAASTLIAFSGCTKATTTTTASDPGVSEQADRALAEVTGKVLSKGPNGEDAAASLKTYPAVFAAVAAVAAGAIFL